MANREWSEQAALAKTARYCSTAEHCEQELRQKLLQWEVPQPMHENIIRYLVRERYLDDARYARAYVHDKLLYNGWGRRKLALMLRAKGISDEVVQDALQQTDEAEYRQVMQQLLTRRKGYPREKNIAFLLQRGFTYDEIRELIIDN